MPNFRLDRFLTLYFFHPLIRKKGPADDKKIPILMYHSISEDKETSHPYYHINTSPSVFAEQMRFLSENGYSVIDIKDLKNITSLPAPMAGEPAQVAPLPPGGGGLGRGGGCPPSCSPPHSRGRVRVGGNYAVITFDDGYRDFYTNAFPILQKYHFPATVFLPTDFINNNRKTFKDKDCLTWPEVRELHKKGITFGSHTASHHELHSLPWQTIRQELSDSKRQIEDELQTAVDSFCYPYAFPQEDRDFVLRFKQELIDQGYRLAVNTVIGRAGRKSDPLCLPRLPVNQADDEKLFAAKLTGAYDWLAGAQALVRRIKSQRRGFQSSSEFDIITK